MPLPRVFRGVIAATTAGVLLAGCSGGGADARGTTGTPSPSATVTASRPTGLPTAEPRVSVSATYSSRPVEISPNPQALVRFDWLNPTPVQIADWTLRNCTGNALLVCVERGGSDAGAVQVSSSTLSSLPKVDTAYRQSGVAAALRAQAEGYLDHVRTDRAHRCGTGYRIAPIATTPLKAGGTDTIRYGFVARTATGADSEMQVQYAAIRDDHLVVLAATAYDAGGCLAPERDRFTSDTLGAFLPVLDTVVRVAQFPTPPE